MTRNILVQEQPLYIEINSDDLEQDFPAIIKTYAEKFVAEGKVSIIKTDDKKCCFTGHRPNKFSFGYNEGYPDCVRLKSLLRDEIKAAINDDYSHFISGGALGVDQWAIEILLELKKQYPHVRIEVALPCIGQDNKWPAKSKERYQKLLEQADIVTYVSTESYKLYLMLKRDE